VSLGLLKWEDGGLIPARLSKSLSGDDRLHWANRHASAAVDAEFGVDFVDVAFGDGSLGTFVFTGAASGAFVGNFVSHSAAYLAHVYRFG
jgi:hypothetical protein